MKLVKVYQYVTLLIVLGHCFIASGNPLNFPELYFRALVDTEGAPFVRMKLDLIHSAPKKNGISGYYYNPEVAGPIHRRALEDIFKADLEIADWNQMTYIGNLSRYGQNGSGKNYIIDFYAALKPNKNGNGALDYIVRIPLVSEGVRVDSSVLDLMNADINSFFDKLAIDVEAISPGRLNVNVNVDVLSEGPQFVYRRISIQVPAEFEGDIPHFLRSGARNLNALMYLLR